MQRMKIPNPEHVPLRAGFNLKLDPESNHNCRTGRLEISIADRDPERPRRKLVFPCVVSPSGRCTIWRIGVKKEYDRESGEFETETPLVVAELPSKLMNELNRLILKIECKCSELISEIKGTLKNLSAIILISPKERNVPKVIEVQEVSLESLPKDIEYRLME